MGHNLTPEIVNDPEKYIIEHWLKCVIYAMKK